ncbi:hypothetical protein QQ054_29645 [Oscillatoria amoena NRMC-F 0135]|nr:hypothetical protein [Oscillatoria amoena NRMC-F 0135]
MQNGFLKIALAAVGLLFLLTSPHAQVSSDALTKADSLFRLKKYTQSLDVYSALFDENKYSPAMLLRMAFIEEGLANYASTIYYLSLYYQHTFDRAATEKIQQLAATHRFTGYEQSDKDRLATAWRRYGQIVTLVLAGIALLLTALLMLSKRKPTKTPVWICQSGVLVLLFIHLNYPFAKKAIIHNNTTYLMSGPSAGATLVAKIGGGHRVTMLGKTDVWVKIRWENKEVFVRESSLKPLER